MYGYIYKTTDLKYNKIYVGKKHSETFLAEQYYGSGIIIQRIIEECKRENIGLDKRLKVEMIDTADSLEELNNKEIYWIEHLNARNLNIGYNLRKGGDCGPGGPMFQGHHHSEETRKKMSEDRMGSQNSNFGNRWHCSDELKQLHSKLSSGENNGMYGKIHSNKTKQLISEAKSGTKRMSNDSIFPKWKMIKIVDSEKYITEGWFFLNN